MNLKEIKNQCNKLYGEILLLIENFGEKNNICRLLLDCATMLLEIGKIDSSHKNECDEKAKKILNCAVELRKTGDFATAYKSLTGNEFNKAQVETKEYAPKRCNDLPEIKDIIQNSKREKCNIIKSKHSIKEVEESSYSFEWNEIPAITFDDVAGLDDVKDAVRRKVLLPLSRPELFEGYSKKNGGGLLLYGPPGTGKTMIAAAIANEIGAKFCSIGASDLVLGGLGNSTKAIVKLFEEARSFDCSVIFFDEIESLCSVSTHAQHTREIRSELLRQIQGVQEYGKSENKILFLIAATNKPWDIDPAFVRPGRFGTRIYVGLPDEQARKYIVQNFLNKINDLGKVEIANDIDFEVIVNRTDGFNSADIVNVLDEVQERSILRSAKTGIKIIAQDDFEEVLQKVTTSVQNEDLKKLQEWQKENG